MIPVRVLSLLVAAAFFAGAATAAHIDQKGGSVWVAKIGPWHINRSTYEDGSRTCWAYNPNYGNRAPTFAYMSAVGGKYPASIMRFDAVKKAKAGETVTLKIGDKAIALVHGKDDVGNAFFPRTRQDARAITSALEQLQASRSRAFYAVDSTGERFKFDARRTTDMLAYLEAQCGYQRH